MADLIVKPTSGGNLILQDEGGDAALTVDVQGNTILTGAANDLGTIAPATIFPSGHIQAIHVINNSTKTTVADNSSYTWGTFTKKKAAETKLMWIGQIKGHTVQDRDHSAQFISFTSSSMTEKKHRGVSNLDHDSGGADHYGYVGGSVDCIYAETYTVKWGWDFTSSHNFTVWNPDASNDARYGGATTSTLIIWEIVI